jgi:hypothetical protein
MGQVQTEKDNELEKKDEDVEKIQLKKKIKNREKNVVEEILIKKIKIMPRPKKWRNIYSNNIQELFFKPA